MLQSKIEQSNGSDSHFFKCLVHNMLPIISDVMVNQFGNYLCQKVFEAADQSILAIIVSKLQADLVEISLNIHGTRALQTLIEKIAKQVLLDHEKFNGDQ